VILYFSKFYPPLLTALVSVAGLVLTEIINYTVFRYVADLRLFRRMLESRVVQKSVNLFNKAPFLTLWVCGFTPIPFYPLRFLVVLARYPLWKYILAVFTSRLPRIYLIALLGDLLSFPDYVIFGIFGLLLAVALAPLCFQLFKKRQKKRLAASPPLGQDGDGLPPE
jgi:ribonucleoside-triphosphate reductase